MSKRGIIVVVFWCILRLAAQTGHAGSPSDGEARALAAEGRWEEIVVLLAPLPSRSAELDFYYGKALARLERWRDAANAFEAGARLAPNDSRFPLELAGVAFEQKLYSQAAHELRKALKRAPEDAYANDFLGTVYFLQGNLEGALKYWNRTGKPRITEVRADPEPQVTPALLDRAFAFAPASTLQLSELLTTDTRVRNLGIFPHYQFDLRAREDGAFDLWFRNQERTGFGQTNWERLFLLFRGLPFLSATPEWYDIQHKAINLVSLIRWDPDKRRVFVQLSSPFESSAKHRYDLTADVRNENWEIRNSFAGSSPILGSLNLRRELLSFNIDSAGARWSWSAGAEVSHRDFRSVSPSAVLSPELLANGYELKQLAHVDVAVLRIPERRFTVRGEISSQVGRLWTQPDELFAKLQGFVEWHWFPQVAGSDYEMRQRVRTGEILGTAPFDELFMLGLERDNDLPLRAHIGTRDGRKGSAPLGADYFLSTWEMDKKVYGNGILTLTLGPFLDIGNITDPSSALGSHKWLFDVGAQTKLRVFGAGIVFSYGKDLRSGNNGFYLGMLR